MSRAWLFVYVLRTYTRMLGTIKTVLKIGSNMLLVVVVVLLGEVVVVSQLKVVCFVVKVLSCSSSRRCRK